MTNDQTARTAVDDQTAIKVIKPPPVPPKREEDDVRTSWKGVDTVELKPPTSIKLGKFSTNGVQCKEVTQVEMAIENNDYALLVDLLDCDKKIQPFDERLHPWADDPQTVGALSATQLAILASSCNPDCAKAKDVIRERGGVEKIVQFLKSGEQDRIHTAVVALGLLTSDCGINAAAAYKANVFPLLIPHITSSLIGLRAAVSTVCRNICLEDESYTRAFWECGGVDALVEHLGLDVDAVAPSLSLKTSDVQLETLLNLEDILENDGGEMPQEYVESAKKSGVVGLLETLGRSSNKEVATQAQDLLSKINNV